MMISPMPSRKPIHFRLVTGAAEEDPPIQDLDREIDRSVGIADIGQRPGKDG